MMKMRMSGKMLTMNAAAPEGDAAAPVAAKAGDSNILPSGLGPDPRDRRGSAKARGAYHGDAALPSEGGESRRSPGESRGPDGAGDWMPASAGMTRTIAPPR